MEDGVVVEAAVDVLEEVLRADRRLLGIELDFDRAEAGVEQDVRVLSEAMTLVAKATEQAVSRSFSAWAQRSLRSGGGCEKTQQGLVEDLGLVQGRSVPRILDDRQCCLGHQGDIALLQLYRGVIMVGGDHQGGTVDLPDAFLHPQSTMASKLLR